ncbi:acylphosphatase [Clostridium weizhouense]|uniref:acylphosphatase n=1 Tax=Clostridium weizhouense TaxID=2859781 RepID=A0ABS7AQL7_9CLOT|nr:acylphosphatase [Clostridium weizhouense]MBW6409981.1 acylphosphatase [Clostridium weizhouense]
MVRYLLILAGRIQGVGFRFFSQLKATELSLTGYAQNLDSGNVKIEIQGRQENIDTFISYIMVSNKFAKVMDINVTPIPLISNEKKFKIKY